MINIMKFNKFYLGLALLPMLASCADYLDTNNYIVEKPASIAEFEYLNDYKPLKEYVNRSAHPGFTLGTGVGVDDYLNQGSVYLLTNSNFDMMTAGNAMKYASCVDDNGNMNFDKVRDFVGAAEAAGMQIYGHTLCWHAQQNTKWLNSLLADKEIQGGDGDGAKVWKPIMATATGENGESANLISRYPGDGDIPAPVVDDPLGGGKVYKSEIGANPAEAWDSQFFIKSDQPLKEGDRVRVSFKYYCSDTRNIDTQAHGNPGEYHHWAFIGTLNAAPEWKEHSWEGLIDASMAGDNGCISIAFNLSSTPDAATFYIDDVAWEIEAAAPAKIDFPLINGADGESGECANLISRFPGNGDIPAPVVDDPLGTGKVYKSEIGANPAEAWDSQFFIKSDQPLKEGDNVKVSFRYRCSDTRNIDTQAHGNPGEYHHWAFIGTLNASPEWKEHSWSGTIDASMAGDNGCISIAFNLSSTPDAATFFIDDVVWTVEMSGNTMPMTPEEKAEALTAEMERWVSGMMNATEGKVKAWDVVNEAISGGPWGQRYDLQHDNGNPNDFFWQDYLGDDFVRIPVKFARQYFEENGGNPEELKLFVNDYNLESDWDDNQKLKSLIQWIEQWESDGVTKIDGIGTQMHISYYLNPETQKSKEDHIVKMFQLMAASGKLCRITELDMGLCDKDGNAIKTADVTVEQHKLMGEHYKWIVEKYFEIIPQAQQFGICQWCQTDAPENSGWRGGEPVGLWNLDLQRKPAYGGFADGLNEN